MSEPLNVEVVESEIVDALRETASTDFGRLAELRESAICATIALCNEVRRLRALLAKAREAVRRLHDSDPPRVLCHWRDCGGVVACVKPGDPPSPFRAVPVETCTCGQAALRVLVEVLA